jgi:uncharacterized protein
VKPAALRAVVLVVLANAILIAWMSWLRATPYAAWEREHLNWKYGVQILFFAIPLSILATRRRSPAQYGLAFYGRRLHARLAVMLPLVLVATPIAITAIFGRLTLNRTFVEFPVSTAVFHFVFSSFGEELFFRGFMQGELNLGFGRPWKVADVPFGPGLVVTTLVFGAAHGVPLLGASEFDPTAILLTACFAFFAGLLRERTGGIFAPAMLHATIDLNWHLLRLHRVLRIAQFVCTGVAFYFILRWIGDERPGAGGGTTTTTTTSS